MLRVFKINDLKGGERPIPVASPPPVATRDPFSVWSDGRKFPLFPRVMADGLFTLVNARRPKSVLRGQYSPKLLTAQIW